MTNGKQQLRGRPKDLEKRAAIIVAARRLFFDHGLEAVKMDAVAEEAGVSKMTVYNNFDDKTSLFEAVVNAENMRIEAEFARLKIGTGRVEDVLNGFGVALLKFLLSSEIMRMDRMLSAELERHPKLGQRFYRKGPLQMWTMLTDVIEAACKRGELKTGNSKRAAENLIALWLGMLPMQHRFENPKPATASEISERVTNGVIIFMSAYKP